jgi:hypothetical protein
MSDSNDVTTGTHDAKLHRGHIEVFSSTVIKLTSKTEWWMLTECFKSMSDIEYINKARELLLRTHITSSKTVHFNGEVYDYRPAYDKDALATSKKNKDRRG